jgi:predicted lipoprotein with Yx(FWY)xxD motif/plastocyanin
MRNARFKLAAILLVAVTLLLSACSSATSTAITSTPASSPSRQPTTTSTPSSTPAPAGYTINVSTSPALGQYLVDGKGMTLYWTTADSPGTSNVPANLLAVWPVFYTPNIVVPTSLDAANFGTITRSDGTLQTTYKDWPLYYYASDSAAGQIGGQGLGGRWSVVSPAASGPQPVTPPPSTSSTTPTPSASSSPTQTPTSTAQSVTIDLIAKNIAYNLNTITVPAGAKVTVNFDNQDSGIPHNFSVYTASSATTSVFVGKIITGPAQTTYTFTAPTTPGNYFFRCDVHPTIMTGTFIVTAP